MYIYIYISFFFNIILVIWRTWNSHSSSHQKTILDATWGGMAQACRPGDLTTSLSSLVGERNVLFHLTFSLGWKWIWNQIDILGRLFPWNRRLRQSLLVWVMNCELHQSLKYNPVFHWRGLGLITCLWSNRCLLAYQSRIIPSQYLPFILKNYYKMVLLLWLCFFPVSWNEHFKIFINITNLVLI